MRIQLIAIVLCVGCMRSSSEPYRPSELGRPLDWKRPQRADFIRGMTVSCPRAGQIWGTEEMESSLRALDTLGVNWISIHPYASISTDGAVRYRPVRELGYLARAKKYTDAQKQKLFLKPHLAYWGSFEWRGAIKFGNNQQAWARFFKTYGAFIVDQAAFAQRAKIPLFAVGVELDNTVQFEAQWRAIIAQVRTVYKGRITYAANWDSVEKVPFWDAVDDIGVQAYFPLGGLKNLTRANLSAAWEQPLAQLRSLSRKYSRPFLFAEIGYPRSLEAAQKPWAPATSSDEKAIALRALLMDVALERLTAEPQLRGVFWWKWIPGRAFFQGDFSMKDPEAKAVLSEYWSKGHSVRSGEQKSLPAK